MIEVLAQGQMDAGEWERLVEACGGNPLHLPAVHEADLPEKDRLHLVFREGSETAACAIAYCRVPRWRRPSWLLLPAPPAVRPDAAAKRYAVYQGLLDFARRSRCRELIVHPHWGTTFDGFAPFSGHETKAVVEFVLDLGQDMEVITSGMHKVHRKNIRRAERDGVTVRQDDSLEALLTLRSMQEVASERSARRGGGFTVRDRGYFERVHRRVYDAGRGELLLAERGGTTVAGLAYLTGARRAITVRSGATPEGYETRAMYLLQNEVIKRVQHRGLIELNLGGVTEEAEKEGHSERGLYDFKRGWGGAALRSTGIRMELGG
jgi:lipid II:glycine glycyltransferase (peptidoglycan interpeptide bridge formation enzyme)